MEHISERIGNCCLYEEKQQDKQLPKYVSAFGQYALVHPPPPPPKTLPTPQSQITRPKPARGRRPQVGRLWWPFSYRWAIFKVFRGNCIIDIQKCFFIKCRCCVSSCETPLFGIAFVTLTPQCSISFSNALPTSKSKSRGVTSSPLLSVNQISLLKSSQLCQSLRYPPKKWWSPN